ncbi:hypothetical protein GOHSU_61_00070 [Gordonia hirsuta DSM 44140 = NBRC 16056]|uniref:DUF8020 domain-containing protein n=1 Tax=Gordonia hirsuta DSM 44140 = NBRC 16056 TaxID=1121927 RepID=L7LCT7_9ACTN|nr:hypothetical protein GOHSU_61_00070 [Gordonia hirsuta DSM 44140 = NBRC 16056]
MTCMTYLLRASWRRILIALIAVIGLLPLTVSPASAGPGSQRATNNGVTVEATTKGNGVEALVSGGTAAIENGALIFRNKAGAVVETTPLSYIGADSRTYPIDATVSGNKVRLAPSTDVSRSAATKPEVLDAVKHQVAAEPPYLAIAGAAAGGAFGGAMSGLTIGFALAGLLPGIGIVLVPFTVVGGALAGGAAAGGMAYLSWQMRQDLLEQQKNQKKQGKQKPGGSKPKPEQKNQQPKKQQPKK